MYYVRALAVARAVKDRMGEANALIVLMIDRVGASPGGAGIPPGVVCVRAVNLTLLLSSSARG
jgi:hypothetical protein